jgi:L-2,4-diaminobutyric acid acetyltransferase
MVVMSSPIRLRTALRGDGSSLWRLVQSTGSLELNSSYFYLTFAEFFGDTCLIAERGNEIAGAVIAFRPPRRSEALFIWQIGVMPDARRQGLGKRMLRELLMQPSCRGVRHLLATVTPGNEASQRMFHGFAKSLDLPLRKTEFFTTDLFPEPHEAEEMITIGPLPANLQDLQGAKNDDFEISGKELEEHGVSRPGSVEKHDAFVGKYASNL